MDPIIETPTTTAPAAAPDAAANDPAPNFDADLADLVSKSAGTIVQPLPDPGAEPGAGAPAEGAAEPEKAADAEPEPEAPAEPPAAKPADTLTKRLALVATGQAKNEARAKELDGIAQSLTDRETKIKADIELLETIRTAPSRVDRVKLVVGGEDQLNDLYLELTDYFDPNRPAGTPVPRRTPAQGPADIEKLVKAGVEKALADVNAARKAEVEAGNKEAKAGYVKHAHQVLDKAPSEFPLCFAAPPTSLAITAISDEILRQTGTVPPVKTVLKMIEDERQARHQKAASKTPAATRPATTAATPTEQTRGAPPSRRTSVPVTTPRVLTFEEELAQVAAKQTGGAA